MQIVIDDEKIIDLLETEWGYEGIREDIARVIRENGTLLPKGHGDLIDRGIVWNQLREKEEYYQGEFMKPTTVVHKASMYGRLCGVTDSRYIVQDAPAIIEADAESEE